MNLLRRHYAVLLLALGWAGMLHSAASMCDVARSYQVYLEHGRNAAERTVEEIEQQPAENLVKLVLMSQEHRKRDDALATFAAKALAESKGRLWLAWMVGTVGLVGILLEKRKHRAQRSPVAQPDSNDFK
jgi:hypothetical protein